MSSSRCVDKIHSVRLGPYYIHGFLQIKLYGYVLTSNTNNNWNLECDCRNGLDSNKFK